MLCDVPIYILPTTYINGYIYIDRYVQTHHTLLPKKKTDQWLPSIKLPKGGQGRMLWSTRCSVTVEPRTTTRKMIFVSNIRR